MLMPPSDQLRLSNAVFLSLVLLLLAAPGCKQSDAPPPALTLEQLPPALEQAFAKAKPEARPPEQEVMSALQAKDYPKALLSLQALAAVPGLNRQQANVVGAGIMTLNNALQQAQSQGDAQAAQALEFYHKNK